MKETTDFRLLAQEAQKHLQHEIIDFMDICGWSDRKICRYLGFSNSTIANWRGRKGNSIGLTTFLTVCIAFKIEPDIIGSIIKRSINKAHKQIEKGL